MKHILIAFSFFYSMSTGMAQSPIRIPLQKGEQIWSGVIREGHKMPFEAGYIFDYYANNNYNQIAPLLVSNQGLYVWSEEPYQFEITEVELIISKYLGKVEHGRQGSSLAEARNKAMELYFPPSGKLPDTLLFAKPQYNTWIELTYNQNQEDILKYAQNILDNDLPPGVLMIDDTWQEDYGLWQFQGKRFPDPKAMMDQLHDMGFKLMLWVVPFVSPDQTLIMQKLMKDKAVLMNKDNENTTWETAEHPAIIPWWNGYSALLDFTNPAAVEWFEGELDRLVEEYAVDGFKLDAGDMHFYPDHALSMKPVTPNQQSELYAQLAFKYPLNEYRACWKLANQPIAQRLHDKTHTWDDVQKLIPHMLTAGITGYTFSCPDMIGGGEYRSFLNLDSYDQDLVVRSAQCHALMPMMQFSVAPWRVLDEERVAAVKRAVDIRMEHTPLILILKLAKVSAENGQPIINNMEYLYPNQGYENIRDQFFLGENILVAPMDKKGFERKVVLPKGKWIADDGKVFKGGKTYTIDVPIDRLPYFTKK